MRKRVLIIGLIICCSIITIKIYSVVLEEIKRERIELQEEQGEKIEYTELLGFNSITELPPRGRCMILHNLDEYEEFRKKITEQLKIRNIKWKDYSEDFFESKSVAFAKIYSGPPYKEKEIKIRKRENINYVKWNISGVDPYLQSIEAIVITFLINKEEKVSLDGEIYE